MDRAPKLPLDSSLLRFGPKAEVLAEALHMMSLSLVKMVLGYLMHPTATAGETPKLVLTFGEKGKADAQFTGAVYGVACSPDHKIWTACDTRVQIFSEDGQFLQHAAKAQWKDAAGIAFDAEGNAYVCDYEKGCINVCKPTGSVLRQIYTHEHGNPQAQFNKPYYAASDPKQGLLFISEYGNRRVLALKFDGSLVTAIGSLNGEQYFNWPRGVAVNSASNVLGVTDQDRVQVFDYRGKLLRRFGSKGAGSGELSHPFGLAIDSAGNWIVADHLNDRVCAFTADGTFITAFSAQRPLPICVDSVGRILVGHHWCVRVFGFEIA